VENYPPESSPLLQSLFEASIDGILAFDCDCRYTAWNRAMERISGMLREQVLGKRAFDVFPFLKDIGEDQFYSAVLKGERIESKNRRYKIPQTGREGFFDAYYSPLHSAGGECVGGVGIIRDITERKLTEELARAAHQRLTLHVENTPLAVIEWDKDFKVSRWSPSAERLFGWTADEILGKRVNDWQFVYEEDVEVVYEVGYRQREGKERHGVSHNRNYRKDGSVLDCDWHNSVLYDESGELVSVLSLVLDVTARKQVEHALRISEEQYRLLFESNPHPMWVYDLETLQLLAVNDAAVDHYGYSREEFLSMSLKEIRPPGEVDKLSDYVRSSCSDLDRAGVWTHRKKDGTIIDVEITAHRLEFAGRPAELVLANDITERQRAEAALRLSEDRYRDLVENSHELMCTHDLDGRIISVNPWAAKVLGYDQNILIGMNVRDGLLPEYRDQFDEYIRAIKTHGFAQGVMQVRTRHGEKRLWEYYNTLRTEGVETPIVRGMAHDVTERKKALAREKEARIEAEAANRLKDEFLSTLSHELRTPLTAIIGWSNLLIQGEVDENKQAQALRTIARNAKSQGQLIDDLLEVSRIITGKLHLEFSPCHLQAVVDAALESIRPTAEAKGIRFEASFEPGVGPVSGDPDRLQQIVWNLLSNAVKFTPRGGVVQVGFEREGSHVEIVVTDTGEGIRPEFLPHVFERFRQADGSTTRVHGGLGLGLAIVRHLVELHGGHVRAESEGEGKGATFTVRLPLLLPQAKPASKVDEPNQTITANKMARGTVPLQGLRVLVVDDEPDARELFSIMLRRCGAEVTTAASAGEALEYLESWKPGVLVADIGMEGEDGYALIRKVRALPKERGGEIPALALTAYARSEDRLKALSAGYQVHLAKPVDRGELAAAVERLVKV
jgi:PAS domain S-box-containing protein